MLFTLSEYWKCLWKKKVKKKKAFTGFTHFIPKPRNKSPTLVTLHIWLGFPVSWLSALDLNACASLVHKGKSGLHSNYLQKASSRARAKEISALRFLNPIWEACVHRAPSRLILNARWPSVCLDPCLFRLSKDKCSVPVCVESTSSFSLVSFSWYMASITTYQYIFLKPLCFSLHWTSHLCKNFSLGLQETVCHGAALAAHPWALCY